MILKNLQNLRKISVLLFAVLFTGISPAHSIIHVHTEFEAAADDHCDGFDSFETGLHLHDASAPHDDCSEMHCSLSSCLPPAKITTGTSLVEHLPVPVALFSPVVPTDGQCTVSQYRQPCLPSPSEHIVLRI
ncbi:MAG: hypothetical protein JW863_24190 [Chitinispirillaceae bacterium]|nr:hypothetical protein [Chitinispirillaceae bacterium]